MMAGQIWGKEFSQILGRIPALLEYSSFFEYPWLNGDLPTLNVSLLHIDMS